MHTSIQPVAAIFWALLLAHLLGDFPLQTTAIARNKGRHLSILLLHGAAHLLCAWLLLNIFTSLSLWMLSLLFGYIAVHLLIDRLKAAVIAKGWLSDNAFTFLLDQALHLLTLGLTALWLSNSSGKASIHASITTWAPSPQTRLNTLAIAAIYVGVVFGGGHLVRYLTRSLALQTHSEPASQLQNAGMYIGWLERSLVITAIALQSPVLVGLILTGKSIARFPEFKEARFSEYFLIGTLLSLSLAILGGLLLLWLLHGVISLK